MVWFPADSSDVVQVVDLSRSKGAIFPASYQPPVGIDSAERFTPDAELILEVEPEIQTQYREANLRFIENQLTERAWEVYGRTLSEKEKRAERDEYIQHLDREVQRLDRWYRQYLGWVNPQGERILLVQFIDFRKDPHRLKRHFDKAFISGWHGWFYSNIRHMEYNIDRNRLNVWGWGHL